MLKIALFPSIFTSIAPKLTGVEKHSIPNRELFPFFLRRKFARAHQWLSLGEGVQRAALSII
jgi:hypothetical protein